MKGHIRERSPGHWAIVIDTHDPATGKRRRKWHSFRGTKRQAQVECAKLIAEAQTGTALDPSRVTLREYLERWLTHIATQITPKTEECYREIVENRIVPALGNVTLAKLRPEQIAQAYADALARGGRDGTGLSPRSVQMMHRTLAQAFKQAVKWQLLASNPAAACNGPRVERREMKVLDMAATASLIQFARGSRIYVPVLLLALCGLRRGEAVALRWNRLDLDAGRMSVSTSIEQTAQGLREKPPKGGRPRSVILPAFLIDELRKHRIKQAEDLLRLGVRQTDNTHICLREDGNPWPPRLITRAFVSLIRASGLPRVRLHDLRHGHATHLLAANTHPKVVQERLGHASIELTLNVYSHVLPSMQEDAAATIDAAMRAALKPKKW
jgi:integrase